MLILAALVLVVLFQVASRSLFRTPALWTEEVARYLLIVLTFIGSAIAVRTGSNVSLDFLLSKFPEKLRSVLSFVSMFVELTFYVAGCVLSVNMMTFSKGRYLVSVQISRAVVYGLVALGFLLMTYRCVLRIYRAVAAKIKKGEA